MLMKKSRTEVMELENDRTDFREALVKRLQETLGVAPKRERRRIERMIKWLVEGATSKPLR